MPHSSFFHKIFSNPPTINEPPLLPLTDMHHQTNTAYSPSLPVSGGPSSPASPSLINSRALAFKMPYLSIEHQDSFLALSREEEHIQQNLHALIDAQSEGLLAGFSGASEREAERSSSTGSRTPTSRSTSTPWSIHTTAGTKSHITTPIRQPTRRKLGLHSARRGITQAISNLAILKAEQGKLLEGGLIEKSSELSTVQTLAQKQANLEEQIRQIEEGEEAGCRISEMRREEQALDGEIKELQTRLWEMKARHKRLLGDIQKLENRVESQLSSYKAALELSEKEAKFLLKRPRAGVVGVGEKYWRNGFWNLPADRRTLPMADEQFREEQQALKGLIEAAEFERKALEEGSVVWEDVVQEVVKMEKMLSAEMQRMTPPRRGFDGESGRPGPEGGMRIVELEMRHAISRLESQLELVRGRGWKLLDCCISAELEAMIEGDEVLTEALNGAGTFDSQNGEDGGHSRDLGAERREERHAGLDCDDGERLGHLRSVAERSEDDDYDEGPGPELLISHFEE